MQNPSVAEGGSLCANIASAPAYPLPTMLSLEHFRPLRPSRHKKDAVLTAGRKPRPPASLWGDLDFTLTLLLPSLPPPFLEPQGLTSTMSREVCIRGSPAVGSLCDQNPYLEIPRSVPSTRWTELCSAPAEN